MKENYINNKMNVKEDIKIDGNWNDLQIENCDYNWVEDGKNTHTKNITKLQ